MKPRIGYRERELANGRIRVVMEREDGKANYRWSFYGFAPYLGTTFDFICHTGTRSNTKRQKHPDLVKGRKRARLLWDAVKSDAGVEVGLLRKPRKRLQGSPGSRPKPRAGATRYDLRNALKVRVSYTPYLGTAEECVANIHPSKTLKTATADELFEVLYAVAWCQAWGKNLTQWSGMSYETSAVQGGVPISRRTAAIAKQKARENLTPREKSLY